MLLNSSNILRSLPKIDKILAWPEIVMMLEKYPRPEVVGVLRCCVDELRQELAHGADFDIRSEIVQRVSQHLKCRATSRLRPVINGSGIVIHTNLGRSPLADEAEAALHAVSAGYSNLEYDLENGERGERYTHVEGLICELTGAEAALVVNNNAAAVLLALSSLANGREVIVSRGELVEIGGSFRIPDVMRQSGAKLVEVGTTNRTHAHDFDSAITPETALLLKVHTSNYTIVGFTADTTLAEMATQGNRHTIPVMLDAGSGCLIDLSSYGIQGEPTIRQYLNDGADVVTFSGDKLLGGPQAGIIAGKRCFIEPMKQHPLLRAIRIDKLTLAALEATLRLYRDERRALVSIPTLRMLTMSSELLHRRADMIIRKLRRFLPESLTFIKHRGESSAGGGSFPLLQLPTTLIEVRISGASPMQIETTLRRTAVPVIGRIHRDRFLLDVRTILDCDLLPLANSLHAADIVIRGES